ncbi:MAG: RdgB/HAM1 family non-canonical purine NTP pyrophosphatase [Verrucomicrobiales bacterium]|nr:RdgB/HAM1 family non-canonical purine NTP pyrophosphatase [Verrucomicrobiales bacterium]
MKTIVIASRNPHKVREFQKLLGSRFKYFTLREFSSMPPIQETGTTFEENARIKAEATANWLLLKRGTDRTLDWAVLGDDSGLEVDALNGDPGLQSARYASADLRISGNAPDAANMAKLIKALEAVPAEQRTARFRCALALTEVRSGLPTTTFAGQCDGVISAEPRGSQGFGYDPVFIPNDFSQTFGELGADQKDRISHRAIAISALRDWVTKRYPVTA